jgi:chromosome segregation ATPase
MAEVMDKPVESQHQTAGRRFTSPNRILARSFRVWRDRWKQKHHQVQAKLEQARQLAAERGTARDRWRERSDRATARATAAEASAARLQGELEQARARIAALEAAPPKKTG